MSSTEVDELSGAPGVRSVDRALDLLSAFSVVHPRLALGELADIAGLPKPSAYRIASTLVRRGYLRQDPATGAYSLGVRLLELGNLVSRTSALTDLAADVMEELSRRTRETILLAEVEWDTNTVVIVGKLAATQVLAVSSPIGQRSSIGGGCMGKAVVAGLSAAEATERVQSLRLTARTARSITDPQRFLAEIRTARRRGYATESEEFLDGVAGVAVPVMIGDRPHGAIGVIAPASRCNRRRLDELGRLIRELMAGSAPADDIGEEPT